jgi:hypothetical protein
VGSHQISGVVLWLCQGQELFGDFPSRLQIGCRMVKSPQPEQHEEDLLCVSNTLTQFSCPGVCVFHFPGTKAFGRQQRYTEHPLEGEFLLCTVESVWQRL